MKTIRQIYDDYKIMPILQEHQLRVAAVGKLICKSLNNPVDIDGVVQACLFHDMGNIIKFDLTYFPESVEPEGLAYWQDVKNSYIAKYGPSEHAATAAIARELGLSDNVLHYLDQIGFSHLKETVAVMAIEPKICAYADMRVGPHGVILIEERLIDGRKRYEGRADRAMVSDFFDQLAESLRETEKQIFSVANIKPEDINDASILHQLDLWQVASSF